MAQVLLTGNRTIYVSDKRGKELVAWKESGREKSSMVDLGNEGFIELGQIRGVKFEATDIEFIQREQQNQKLQELIREWNAHIEKLRTMPVEEKAHWMNRTFCQLLYNARLNKGRLDKQSDLYLDLFNATTGHFEAHSDDYHAPKEVYQHLIGQGELNFPKEVSGFKSIGRLIQQQINI